MPITTAAKPLSSAVLPTAAFLVAEAEAEAADLDALALACEAEAEAEAEWEAEAEEARDEALLAREEARLKGISCMFNKMGDECTYELWAAAPTARTGRAMTEKRIVMVVWCCVGSKTGY
jgi:hypothetical protein